MELWHWNDSGGDLEKRWAMQILLITHRSFISASRATTKQHNLCWNIIATIAADRQKAQCLNSNTTNWIWPIFLSIIDLSLLILFLNVIFNLFFRFEVLFVLIFGIIDMFNFWIWLSIVFLLSTLFYGLMGLVPHFVLLSTIS